MDPEDAEKALEESTDNSVREDGDSTQVTHKDEDQSSEFQNDDNNEVTTAATDQESCGETVELESNQKGGINDGELASKARTVEMNVANDEQMPEQNIDTDVGENEAAKDTEARVAALGNRPDYDMSEGHRSEQKQERSAEIKPTDGENLAITVDAGEMFQNVAEADNAGKAANVDDITERLDDVGKDGDFGNQPGTGKKEPNDAIQTTKEKLDPSRAHIESEYSNESAHQEDSHLSSVETYSPQYNADDTESKGIGHTPTDEDTNVNMACSSQDDEFTGGTTSETDHESPNNTAKLENNETGGKTDEMNTADNELVPKENTDTDAGKNAVNKDNEADAPAPGDHPDNNVAVERENVKGMVGPTDKLEADNQFHSQSREEEPIEEEQNQKSTVEAKITDTDDVDKTLEMSEICENVGKMAGEAHGEDDDTEREHDVAKDEDDNDNSEADKNEQDDIRQTGEENVDSSTDYTGEDTFVSDHQEATQVVSTDTDLSQYNADREAEIASHIPTKECKNINMTSNISDGHTTAETVHDSCIQKANLGSNNNEGRRDREHDSQRETDEMNPAYDDSVSEHSTHTNVDKNVATKGTVAGDPALGNPLGNPTEDCQIIAGMAEPTDKLESDSDFQTDSYKQDQEKEKQKQESFTEMAVEKTCHDYVDKTVQLGEVGQNTAEVVNAGEGIEIDDARKVHVIRTPPDVVTDEHVKGNTEADTNEQNDVTQTGDEKLEQSDNHSYEDSNVSDQQNESCLDSDKTMTSFNSPEDKATEMDMRTSAEPSVEVSSIPKGDGVRPNNTENAGIEIQQGGEEVSSKTHKHDADAETSKATESRRRSTESGENSKHLAAAPDSEQNLPDESVSEHSTHTNVDKNVATKGTVAGDTALGNRTDDNTAPLAPHTNGIETEDTQETGVSSDLKHPEAVTNVCDEERSKTEITPVTAPAADKTTDGFYTDVGQPENVDLSVTTTEENAALGQTMCGSGDKSFTDAEGNSREELVHFATCPSCEKVTTSIKLLPCMDFVCLDCLQQQLSTQHSLHEMNCLSCDQVFSVPQQGLEDLPSNVYVRPIVPGCVEQSSSRREKQGALSCSVCGKKTIAAELKYCKECRQHLCKQCSRVHRKIRATQAHHVVSNRQPLLLDVDSLNCPRHPSKTLEVFCDDCATLCCVVCLRQTHNKHNWSDVDSVYDRFRQQLGNDVEVVRGAGIRCEEQLQQVANAEDTVTEYAQAVKSKIDAQRHHLIDWIDREVSMLHDSVSEVTDRAARGLIQNKERVRKQKQILDCFEKFCRTAIDKGTVNEVIHVYQSIHDGDAELPLQQVSTDIFIPQFHFAPVKLCNFLPERSQQLIGSVSFGDLANQNTTELPLAWQQLHDRLQETRGRLEQLMEKDEIVTKELEKKNLQVDELERQTSNMADISRKQQDETNSLREELQQKDSMLISCAQQVESLGHQLVENEQKYCEMEQTHQRHIREYEMRMEQLQVSERNAAECRIAVLNGRVQELEELLSDSVNKEQQMESLLEDYKQQISEQSLIIDHVPPTAVKVCSLSDNKTPAYGVTTVDHYLYVVRAWSKEIEVYDCSTYSLQGHIPVPNLQDVTDMAGCEHQCRLYVADCNGRAVHTVSTNVDAQVPDQWEVPAKPYGISISEDCLVIVSFSEVSTVGVFSHAGKLLRQICVATHVVNLRHAVVMDTGQLVICHGSLHRHAGVSVIDADGNIDMTLPAAGTSTADAQLAWPTHVAVDRRGFVYVADYSGKRILQLDADLTHITDIVGYDQGLHNPRSVCLDSVGRRMYVAESGGNVLVFGLH